MTGCIAAYLVNVSRLPAIGTVTRTPARACWVQRLSADTE